LSNSNDFKHLPMDNPHISHRKRMKKRFCTSLEDSSTDNFSDHELIEFLLFYCIRRRNTNVIAHSLLNHFGSLDKVFEASYDELLFVDGIGKESATLIKLVSVLFNRFSSSKQCSNRIILNTAEKIGDYLLSKYAAFPNETFFVLFLDSDFSLLGEKVVFHGSISSCPIYLNQLASEVFSRRIPQIVIAHNHPNSGCEPSDDYLITTLVLKKFFETAGVNLVEHFIVTHDDFMPILRESIKYGLRHPEEIKF